MKAISPALDCKKIALVFTNAISNRGIAMTLLGDIMQVLESVKGWNEIQAAPARIDALERRMAQLESALKIRPPADLCPKCSTGTLKVVAEGPAPTHALRLAGIKRRALACSDPACGHAVDRMVQVGRR